MKRSWWMAVAVGLALVAGLAVMASGREDQAAGGARESGGDRGECREGEPAETVVTLEQVPAAVAATIKREAAGSVINEIVRKDGCGHTLYEAELVTDGRERDLLVDPDGKVVTEAALRDIGEQVDPGEANGEGEETDRRAPREQRLTLEQCPPPVAETIRREAAGATIAEIVKAEDGGKPVYEATLTANGAERELVVAADGKLLEATVTLEQCPAPVAATIRRVSDGMTVREVVRVDENGQTVYEATICSRGREGEVRVAPDGSVLPEEAEADEAEDEGEDEGGNAGETGGRR